jgi:hypothetical protein
MHKFTRFLKEDLSLTFEYHDELNPMIWEDDKLKENIKERLLQIGKMFAVFANIPESAIRDIVFTGGNANYNYTPFSDLDVHLLVNMKNIPVSRDFLDDYLYDKKLLWAYKHPALTVMGYPVELYAQSYREKLVSPKANRGVYSLMNDRWLFKPRKETPANLDKDEGFKHRLEGIIKNIENILIQPGDHSDDIRKLKVRIRNMRTAGIHKSGELSTENLLFKELRNMGYIDKLNDYLQKTADRELSIY